MAYKNEIDINGKISFIRATENPLSADIGIIRSDDGLWLFDVGADEGAVSEITDDVKVVISHFHQDHTANIDRVKVKEAYVSAETFRHVGFGQVVKDEVFIGNLHIFSLPSSHCKGCLGLEVDEAYAFIGDGLYSKVRDGYYIYNAQLLKEEIEVLKMIKAPVLLVSHFPSFIRQRTEVIEELEKVYSFRKKDSSEIAIPREGV